jgi:RNA polymerase sigma factor (sigma-70 family)
MSSAQAREDRFATTRWTLVAAASRQSSPQAADALAELCQIYWPPLYGYLRGRGHDREDAQDLTQGFFTRLLQRRDLRVADPERGPFRAFLLTSLKRYAINEHERSVAVRRGGRSVRLSLDFEEAERVYTLERRPNDSPDRAFDRKWAGIVLDRALDRLREECHQTGRGLRTERLLPYLTETGNLGTYRAAAAELRMSEGAVKVAVHRLRQRFGAILRLEIAETVRHPSDVAEEMRELLRAVSD